MVLLVIFLFIVLYVLLFWVMFGIKIEKWVYMLKNIIIMMCVFVVDYISSVIVYSGIFLFFIVVNVIVCIFLYFFII